MQSQFVNRRGFLRTSTAGLGMFAAGIAGGCGMPAHPGAIADLDPLGPKPEPPPLPDAPLQTYNGPNVFLIRFGGGVRRTETVQHPDTTYCPFLVHDLAAHHGVLYPQVEMAHDNKVETSHGQGTLYLLTGQYEKYEDVGHKFLGQRFEAKVPTLFEYFRKKYDVPEHQAIIVNGEDRIDEEFYTFSNHHLFGVNYRSTVLSLYRYKTYLVWRELKDGRLSDKQFVEKLKQLREMERLDYRVQPRSDASVAKDEFLFSKHLDQFWDRWCGYYGKTGLVNPRGDRLLTELTTWAMKHLRPKLVMINYNDPDYVHWGPPSFYTRGISIIDDGIRQLWHAAQADEAYRDNTVFVIVPDCGRDNSRGVAVPFQHHFNSKSSREIFAVVAGPKKFVRTPTIVDKTRQQIRVTATIGRIMGFATPHTQTGPLEEVFA